ncbi:MAG: aldehyde ferredoxin oxidoreductase N-terminal domain-containing protein [Dehalococcoidia bacterium]
MAEFGYAGQILKIDLSSGMVEAVPTESYTGLFLGGRGIGAKVCWDEIPPETGAFDAENRLVFATGPMAGVPVIGGSRWEVCGKSPATSPEHFNYCNLGGRWGAELKFSGYDALVVSGKAETPVYILIDESGAGLRDARSLWGHGAHETREVLKAEVGESVRVVAIGPAGENRVVMASLLAENDASGSGGLGAVMGSKNLKAVGVIGKGKKAAVAWPDRLKELTGYYRSLKRINLRFPAEFSATRQPMAPMDKIKKQDPCYGCVGCYRMLYQSRDGSVGKFMCNSGMFYQHWASMHGGEWMDVAFHATRLADTYGLDTKAIDRIIYWLHDCYQKGILTEESSGLPLSKTGTAEFIEELAGKISFREGIGDLLASGLEKAAGSFGEAAQAVLEDTSYVGLPGYRHVYSPQLYTPHAVFYAMEPRLAMAQFHELGTSIPKWMLWTKGNPKGLPIESLRAISERFWGGELAVDFSTWEGNAMAARMIQDREYAKACLILCDNIWPVIELKSTEDHIGDPTLESRLVSAVTGRDIDERELYHIGERVFNLQRAILVREGHRGREDDTLPEDLFSQPLELDFLNPECLVPGKDGEPVSRRGEVIDREEFSKMMKEYYALRKWDDAAGLQTREQLEALELGDVASDLSLRGLLDG